MEKLRKLLHKIAAEKHFQNYDLQADPISNIGENYTSLLYTASITSRTEKLDLFIKAAVLGETMREQMNLKIYEKEIFVYTELKKDLRALEENNKVSEKHRFYIPECYAVNTTPLEEMIVLENLTSKGFATHNRMKPIDWEYATTAVSELVKLHALSIVYIEEHPQLNHYLTEPSIADWHKDGTLNAFWTAGFKATLSVTREENKGKMKRFLDSLNPVTVEKMYEPLRCKVITHVDFRPSNLMHKRRNDCTLEIIAVDYQMMKVGCPVVDLLYFIFTGTDKLFRDQYFHQLIDHYYEQLKNAMERLGIDPETKYSRADFDFELKEKLPTGLLIATFILPYSTMETDDAPRLDADMDLSISKTGSLFPDRMNEVVDDYVRWGVLKE